MAYALFNSATSEIVQGPWGRLPGRLDWGNGSQISPVEVGITNGDLIVVSIVDTDAAPDRWHTDTGNRSYSLDGSEVTVTREYARTKSPTAQMVKDEAYRRIVSVFPEWKQRNMTMRAVELVDKKVRGEALTEDEQAEEALLNAAKDGIKAVRAASDTIEAMDPIPDDFNADERWP